MVSIELTAALIVGVLVVLEMAVPAVNPITSLMDTLGLSDLLMMTSPVLLSVSDVTGLRSWKGEGRLGN